MRKKPISTLKKVIQSPYTLLVIALYIGLSLYLSLIGNEESLGWMGTFVGFLMIEVFGASAWGLPLLLGYIAIKELRTRKVKSGHQYRLVGLLLISASFLGSFLNGGILGNSLWEIAESLVGEITALIVLVALFIFCAFPVKSQEFFLELKRYFLSALRFSASEEEKQDRGEDDKSKNKDLEPEPDEETNRGIREGLSGREKDMPVNQPDEPKPSKENHKPDTDYPRPVLTDWGSELPSLDFLEATEQTVNDVEEIRDSAESLDKALRQFQIKAKVEETLVAPMVLTHFVKTQGGTKISEIERHLADVSRYMGLPEDVVRLNLDMEGKEGKIAVEVPLKSRRNIGLLELMQSAPGEIDSIQLPLRLGVSTLGRTICTDLTEMPHLLVAGSTGSGKSIALNSMLVSLLFNCSPAKLRLVLIDPKMVEFSHFRGLPHLHGDVITESDEAIDSLNGLTDIMDHRYRLLNESGFRNLAEYNEAENNGEDMPHIVVVIDELADLLMVEGKVAEEPIVRLAQKARAAGIHLIMATQRPTADVITGLIKTNVPARLAFRVSSNVDSRVILNQKGAEALQGKGDALFLNPAGKGLIRLQSPMVGLEEIERVTGFWKSFC